MSKSQDKMISKYMSYLRVNLIISAYNQVPLTWKDTQSNLGYCKIYFIEKGDGVIYIDGVAYYPKPGDMMFIPEGCTHGYSTISPKTYTKHWCHFNAYIGSITISDFLDIPYMKTIKNPQKIISLFEDLTAYYNSDNPFSPLNAQATLMQLLSTYFSEICNNEITLKTQATDTKLNLLLDFIEENLHTKITINELADYMNLHPNYLIRLFTSTFGLSPMEYINRLRIERAKELLTINNESIKLISELVGFSTPYYFSLVFKKQTGLSPKQYRQLTSDKL
ncbi:AraC family transcriptional regulator [Vallitalea sediminicola]